MDSLAKQVGIDVSKSLLDVRIEELSLPRIANNAQGIASLIPLIPEGAVVQLEASGGYDRLVRRMLSEAGFVVHRHNPRKVRRMADGVGISAKTDALDAKLLVKVGPMLKSPHPKSAEQEALCDISRTIATMQKDHSNYAKRLESPELSPIAAHSIRLVMSSLKQEMASLEAKFKALVLKSHRAQAYKMVMTARCLGPKTARVLICELPVDLKELTTSQITAYSGLAPMDNSSGNRNAPKHLKAGNMHLKAAFYMPAVSALIHYDWARSIYARLRAKGHEHQQAIVPVMRRLLRMAVAILRRLTPWTEIPMRA